LLSSQLSEPGWEHKLRAALHKELNVEITREEIESAGSVLNLSDLFESRLPRDPTGRSVVDVYTALEQFAREELSHDINYHWHAAWRGDVLHKTDSLEDVEILLRMEEAFGFSISNQHAQEMQTVGQSVRYVWRRICEPDFKLRERPEGVCGRVFILNELRRLLMRYGGVPRKAVRLDARLGDLLPSRYVQFWKQIPSTFGVDMPHSNLLTSILRKEKRTTIKELLGLIVSSK
jgi:acyl carrier protein